MTILTACLVGGTAMCSMLDGMDNGEQEMKVASTAVKAAQSDSTRQAAIYPAC